MIYVLGWLLCLCLLVKGLDIAGSQAHQREGKMTFIAGLAVAFAIVGAVVFALWITDLSVQIETQPF